MPCGAIIAFLSFCFFEFGLCQPDKAIFKKFNSAIEFSVWLSAAVHHRFIPRITELSMIFIVFTVWPRKLTQQLCFLNLTRAR